MVTEAFAVGTGLALSLICLRMGQGPITLAIIVLLHVRTVGVVLRLAARAAWLTIRTRYWECYHHARWEATK